MGAAFSKTADKYPLNDRKIFNIISSGYIRQYVGSMNYPLDIIPIIVKFGIYIEGLIGYWKFDTLIKTGGLYRFKDDSINSNDYILRETQIEAIEKWCITKEKCIHLSTKTKSMIRIGNNDNTLDCNSYNSNSITVGIWVNKCGKSDGPLLSYRGKNGNVWNFHFWLFDHAYFTRVCGKEQQLYPQYCWTGAKHTGRLLNNNQWNFVVTTYDYDTGCNKIYVNGVCKGQIYIGKIKPIGTCGDIVLGKYRGRSLNAKLKKLQIYNRCLTEYEIKLIQTIE